MHVDDALGGQPEHAPTRDEQREPGCGCKDRRELAGRLDDVLEVVEDDEKLPVGQFGADRRSPVRGLGLAETESSRERWENLLGPRERREVDEQRAVHELTAETARNLDRKPGLADPTGPHERDEPRAGIEQELSECLQLAVAADRRRRRGRHAPCGGARDARRIEKRIVAEDPALELTELGSRLEPELGVEVGAPVAVAGERIRLPARAVERRHQLGPQMLPEGMLGDQPFEAGDELRVTAEPQPGLEPQLEALQPELLEP